MFIARILGTVVATRKDEKLEGFKLLVVQPIDPSGKDNSNPVVAVDTVSAGAGERVLVVTGSSARMTLSTKDTPVDAAIVGIIDTVSLDRKKRGTGS